MALGCRLDQEVPVLSLAACHVFNGETMPTTRQQAVLNNVLCDLLKPVAQREATLGNFVMSRGNGHKWTRSFLHELCCRMDLELQVLTSGLP
ncbi:hypothetical protein PI126_g4645 [Phytophthora idaei]|nr:hypothetical protein PI126_g4645 [Phytophthora idaei]